MFFPVLIVDLIHESYSGWESSSASSLCGCLALVGENKGNKLKKILNSYWRWSSCKISFHWQNIVCIKSFELVVTAAIYGICFNVR